MVWFRFCWAIFLGILAAPAYCKEELAVEISRLDVSTFPELELLFSVRDPLGRPLENLQRESLRLFENEIRIENYFMSIASEPAEIAIVIDDSGSMHNYRRFAARAVKSFVGLMQSGDRATVISFADTVQVLQGLSPSGDDIVQSVRQLKGFGATALYDAIYKSAEILSGGNKSAIVLLSDGMDQNRDNTDRQSGRSAIEAVTLAANKRIRIFAVGLGRQINREELKDFARLTKGSFYFAPSANQLSDIYGQVARNIKSDVRIRYPSPNIRRDALKREVELSVRSENRVGTAKIDWLAPGRFVVESSGYGYDVNSGTNNRDATMKFVLQDEHGGQKTGSKEFLHSFINQLGK